MVAQLDDAPDGAELQIDAPTAEELTAEASQRKQATLQRLLARSETLAHRGARMVFVGLALDILIVCFESDDAQAPAY